MAAKISRSLIICLVLGVTISALRLPLEDDNDSDSDLIMLNNQKFQELRKEKLDPPHLDLTIYKKSEHLFRYTLGNPNPFDQRLAEINNTYNFKNPDEFQLTLNYPEYGVGGLLTYVEIIVGQDNTIGQAYTIDGGLGQRFVKINVDSKVSTRFYYRATFYGLVLDDYN